MAADVSDRRSIVVAGAAVFGALLVLVLVAVLADGDAGDPVATTTPTVACAPGDAPCPTVPPTAERPGIIPRPGEGHAPDDPGDRGGWEQLALLGVIVAALAVIAAVIARSARRARRADEPSEDGTAVGASP